MKTINDNIRPIIALLVIVLGFGYFYLTFFWDEKPNDQILIAIVGVISGVMGYYFGSSTGATKKDETINNLIEKQK